MTCSCINDEKTANILAFAIKTLQNEYELKRKPVWRLLANHDRLLQLQRWKGSTEFQTWFHENLRKIKLKQLKATKLRNFRSLFQSIPIIKTHFIRLLGTLYMGIFHLMVFFSVLFWNGKNVYQRVKPKRDAKICCAWEDFFLYYVAYNSCLFIVIANEWSSNRSNW